MSAVHFHKTLESSHSSSQVQELMAHITVIS